MAAFLGCLGSLLQLVLFIFNFALWAAGLVIVVVGLWAYLSGEALPYIDIINDADSLWSAAMITLIIIGAVMFFLGYLGCHGSCHTNSLMLFLYAILMGVIVIAEIVVIILAIVFYDQIEGKLLGVMKDQLFYDYKYQETGVGLDGAWNKLMVEKTCCGAESYEDFIDGAFYNKSRGIQNIPYACCQGARSDNDNFAPPPFEDMKICNEEAESKNPKFSILHPKGCYEELIDWIEGRAIFLICVGCGFLLLQIILIIITALILKSLKPS